MHPIIKKCGFLLFPIMLLLFLGATVSKMDTTVHTVVAGESLSLICIDYYGYY